MEPDSKKRKLEEDFEKIRENVQIVNVNVTPTTSSSSLEEFSEPSTSSGGPRKNEEQLKIDENLQKLLLSSPAHLFSTGLQNQQSAACWEQWLCLLATNLTPEQWQTYWLSQCSLFGEQSVPVHLLSFFAANSTQTSNSTQISPIPNPERHENYVFFDQHQKMGNAASGGGGNSSRRDLNYAGNAMVFSNGRLAAAETS
ncbi:unnamed protein product [Caenorhabditis angaria]|uniref:Uncharacterized protein n=1 Tax=Caenorhabditis angaria TaxID=860376 RepID=A0A9P1I6U4_9PELO|nr:unnamed protein product [Caenorhabditis angaria]